jgi:hypothetical protein
MTQLFKNFIGPIDRGEESLKRLKNDLDLEIKLELLDISIYFDMDEEMAKKWIQTLVDRLQLIIYNLVSREEYEAASIVQSKLNKLNIQKYGNLIGSIS